MFDQLRETLFNKITLRLLVLFLFMLTCAIMLIYRLFDLQIVHGQEYLDNFQLKIMKEKTLPGTRGRIYDRDGNLLAYNELAYSVTIEDVYEGSSRVKNAQLNETIYNLIQIIERNGNKSVSDFKIILNKNNQYEFTVEGTQLLRFLADVYGKTHIDNLDDAQRIATADEIVQYLGGTKRFAIGHYEDEEDDDSFVVGLGYSKEEVLKIMTIRYDMNNNSYQKYIATTVATNVNEETVAVIMENSNDLAGVQIIEDTIRKYVDSIYFSNIIGYTGKASQEDLKQLNEQAAGDVYDSNDTVGKLGIEQSEETVLQGNKGREVVFVNSVGKVIETSDYVEPVAGNDIYLTIDKELQEAVYHILEEKLAAILVAKVRNIKEYIPPENASSSKIVIPIYDVYFALINNNIIDTGHFNSSTAGENEIAVKGAFESQKVIIFNQLLAEMTENKTPYNQLTQEYQIYQSFIVEMLYEKGIIKKSEIDTADATYNAWTNDEVISLYEYLNYCISMNWIDVTQFDLEKQQYLNSEEIYQKIVDYILRNLDENMDFAKKMYRSLIKQDIITGRQICNILLEQGIVEVDDEESAQFKSGMISPYTFLINRISALDITPAQLALDPYSGSIVVTDVQTGDVLALVSYPGYDNNKMANGVDAEYYSQILNDLSRPMNNYATMQRTAPGSTFKMVSATAGFMENVITPTSTFVCHGIFDKIVQPPRCWIYPNGSHGALNVTGAVRHSCNVYFYELGYQLGTVGNNYSPNVGLEKLERYADMYGLTEVSGVEIEEYAPQVSTEDAVRSAIGQGNNNFTTVGLARYVTTVANSGTCYNLTLIDRVADHNGNLLYDNEAEIRNTIAMDSSQWNAIQSGMRQVVEGKSYFANLGITAAGKTGTAQESNSRANHALFVCYAPYEVPEIAVTTRIAFGYTSDYAAQTTREVLKYYFELADEEELITGGAGELDANAVSAD